MSTPNRIDSWTLLVSKFKDSIFMNKIRLNEGLNGWTDHRSEDRPQTKETVDRNPFFVSKMAQIITQPNRQSVERVVNEFEKYFSCYETQIGICFELNSLFWI